MSIQMVILFPLALTMIFLAVQGAVFYHGRGVAMAAAQEGARDAAAKGGTDGQGRQAALDFARRVGGDGTLGSPQVQVERGETSVTVTVTGSTLSVIPGWETQVSQSSTRSLEDYSSPDDPSNPGGIDPGGEDPTRPLPVGGRP